MTDNDEVNNLIKDCYWRNTTLELPICTAKCATCASTISKGNCETLQKYFSKNREEEY